MKCFIISSFRNIDMYKELRQALTDEGHTLVYDWIEKIEGRKRTRHDPEQKDFLREELAAIKHADMVFLIMPSRFDAMVEFGAAISQGIPVTVIYPEKISPYNKDDDFDVSYFNHDLVSVTRICKLKMPSCEEVSTFSILAGTVFTPE